jgi:hypothetical protein
VQSPFGLTIGQWMTPLCDKHHETSRLELNAPSCLDQRQERQAWRTRSQQGPAVPSSRFLSGTAATCVAATCLASGTGISGGSISLLRAMSC